MRRKNPSIREALKKAFTFVLRFPLILLTVQIPSSLFEWFTRGVNGGEDQMAVGILLLPLFVMISSVTIAANYACIRLWETSREISFKNLLYEVGEKLLPILGVSIAAGLITLVGLATLLLPGFYLMAAYLYSPLLVVEDRRQPILVYLYVSKELAKRSWFQTMIVLASTLGLGFGANALLSSNLTQLFASVGIAAVWAGVVGLAVSAVISVFTNSWVSYYFLALAHEYEKVGTDETNS